MESLCFSPPLNFKPPSPITVAKPLPPLSKILAQLALVKANSISSSLALGATNAKFSLMVPAKSCVSWVTKLIWFLRALISICAVFTPFIKISPSCGSYKPTSNFTRVLLPAPDGPTKAIVSPFLASKLIWSMALKLAV